MVYILYILLVFSKIGALYCKSFTRAFPLVLETVAGKDRARVVTQALSTINI